MTVTVTGENARVVPFEGIHNFRDCGGYATHDGGRLRWGRLYRSAQHFDATEADLARVAALDLAAVVDMRRDRERELAPCPRPRDFGAKVLFVSDATLQVAPHIAAAHNVSDPETAALRMIDAYSGMALWPAFRTIVNAYFTALAEAEGPVLIHCMAGKDRTGIAVALLHRAMGVSREDWMADYLMTNVTGNVEGRIAAGAVSVRATFGRHLDDATVRVLMSVRPEYLDSCFAGMDARHGGVMGYLESCGVDETLIARVRERLVERG